MGNLFWCGLAAMMLVATVNAAEKLDFDKAIVQVAEAERRLTNLEVHGTSRVFNYSKESGDFAKEPSAEAEVICHADGSSRGKIRVDVLREWWAKVGGPTPVANMESQYIVAFDGQQTMRAILRSGSKALTAPKGGTPGAFNMAFVEPKRSDYFSNGAFQAAWGYLLSANYAYYGKSSSEYIMSNAARLREAFRSSPGGVPFEFLAERQETDGNSFLFVRTQLGPKNFDEYWFDERRGLALTRQRSIVGGQVRIEVVVSELVEAAPGVWYPTRGVRVSHGRDRVEYVAKSVRANIPGVGDEVYSVRLPSGFLVQDNEGHLKQVAPTTQEQKRRLDQLLNKAVIMSATQPSTQPGIQN